jgi:hypothetical protein
VCPSVAIDTPAGDRPFFWNTVNSIEHLHFNTEMRHGQRARRQ